jgi:hypothetical protein
MDLEFVDRASERKNLFRLIRIKPSRPRVITLDSPAGMGKTRLLLEVCRDLVKDAYRHQVEWRIVRLDFRKHFPQRYRNEQDVIEEIARQICRDTTWSNIFQLIQESDPDDQLFIQQATLIPLENAGRQALLHMATGIPPDVLAQINHLIAEAFENADIEEARRLGNLLSVQDLVGFILDKRNQPDHGLVPDHMLIMIDGMDAITDKGLRGWMVNNLALGVGIHGSLQNAFRRFVVVISGRFVEQDLDPSKKERDFLEIPLRSFADESESVGDLISQFDDHAFNAQDDMVSRLARKLCQVCGGHPRVIKEAATKLYARPGHFAALDMDPEGIDYWYTKEELTHALRQDRQAAISEILEGVGHQEQCLLGLLSIFRRFYAATLEFLSRKIQEEQLHEYYDCFQENIGELYNRLKDTRLIGNDEADGPFDSDRFSLNLLSAQMRDQDPQMFQRLNEWAVDLFADWVKGKFSDEPDAPLQRYPLHQRICVCEWLFHRLQLTGCCSELADAGPLGQEISDELEEILEPIAPFPRQPLAEQRQWIRKYVENDNQIDHLIWEISNEDKARHDIIRGTILQAF